MPHLFGKRPEDLRWLYSFMHSLRNSGNKFIFSPFFINVLHKYTYLKFNHIQGICYLMKRFVLITYLKQKKIKHIIRIGTIWLYCGYVYLSVLDFANIKKNIFYGSVYFYFIWLLNWMWLILYKSHALQLMLHNFFILIGIVCQKIYIKTTLKMYTSSSHPRYVFFLYPYMFG